MAEQSPVIGEAETVERVDNTSDMTGPGDNIPDTNSTPPEAAVPAIVLPAPSKKYLKKMAKHAKYEVIKKLKRKAEKEKMKLKRLQARENGTISLMPITRKILLKTVAPIDFDAVSARVVIDCSFDQHMTKDEKTKTCKQLLRVYTLNRRAPRPMPVYFCGLKEGTEMMEIFKKNDGYEHWDVSNCRRSWWATEVIIHALFLLQIKVQEPTYLEQFPKERLVYLTSDSDNILGELNQDDVYVIGGLVDHNRYKGICHDTATEKGIRHARLPIKENILLKCRTVLTIEQGQLHSSSPLYFCFLHLCTLLFFWDSFN